MQRDILISNVTIDELETRLVNKLKQEFGAITAPKNEQENFITSKEASNILGVSLVTIHQWKKGGKLKFHRFGSRIRFKRSEIEGASKYSTKSK